MRGSGEPDRVRVLDEDLVPHEYIKLNRVGKGSFAACYKAIRCETGETVCLKVTDLCVKKIDTVDVRDEMNFLRKLHHPNCLSLQGYGHASHSIHRTAWACFGVHVCVPARLVLELFLMCVKLHNRYSIDINLIVTMVVEFCPYSLEDIRTACDKNESVRTRIEPTLVRVVPPRRGSAWTPFTA
jgi:serine/threonine protein kinase